MVDLVTGDGSTIAREALRGLILILQRHLPAADLLPVLDAERAFLIDLIEKEKCDD